MKKVFSVINILSVVVMLFVLLFMKLSDNMVYIMTMSFGLGWLIPYIVLFISGVMLYKDLCNKKFLIGNILSICMDIYLLVLMISIYDKGMLGNVIEYGIIMVINIINCVIGFKDVRKVYKKNKEINDKESTEIKDIKQSNTGAIV